MKDIVELADTVTSTTGIGSITPEVWSKILEKTATAKKVARQFVRINRDLVGTPGDSIWIPVANYSAITAESTSEGSDITPAALDYSNTKQITPVEVGAAVRISKEVVENVCVDILRDATDQLAEALAQKEDKDILDALGSATTNKVFANGRSAVNEIQEGDILTPALIASAITEVRKDNYNPDVLFIHPAQEGALLQDSQFVNAATYGSADVVKNGEIGKYLGLTVISTTNVPTFTGSGGATYHKAIIADSKHAGILVIKRDPTIETDYETLKGCHLVVAREKYKADLLIPDAVCVIYSADK